MPCYNAATTLPMAIESITSQTTADFEVVAVDDGSTDQTAAVLAAWAQRDQRVRIISQVHDGIITALNTGLAACGGEYVARMDADDHMHPERLALQAALLDQRPEIGVASCLVDGFPPEQVRQGFAIYLDWLNALTTNADIRREMFVESPLPHPSVMFRRQLVTAIGGYQEHGWAEDYDLWLRLYLQEVGFAKVPQVLLSWREHPDRLTRQDSRYSLENFIRAKAHYLALGPLQDRDAVLIWGSGMHGKRISKHLLHAGVNISAFVDIDPKKIGRTRRDRPILAPEAMLDWWRAQRNPAVLAAVGARGARHLIRQSLHEFGLIEGQDWWGAA